ncbi:uncharacterized protein F5891DRAFT_932159, partial [Suillus fuscotomentosus]
LSGCVNMQFIVYCRVYFHESWRTKRMPAEVRLFDLCHSALVASAVWDSIIASDSGLDTLDTIPWYMLAISYKDNIILTHPLQFAYRIYRLQNKKFTVVIPIVCFAFKSLLCTQRDVLSGCALSRSFVVLKQIGFSWIFTMGLSLSTLVDIMITTFMCYFFRRTLQTDIYSSHSTIRIIDALTFWTIQNGSMTSTATIATLICWKVMPQNLIFLGIHFIVAK